MINDISGKLIADKYLVENLIRENHSGDLYLGKHEILDKPVMLKALAPVLASDNRWVRRFIEEARTASAIEHPNILALNDFGTDAQGVTYAVFENIPTTTLGDLMAAETQLDESRALNISRQIAAALIAAQAKKVSHGRLDPRNIFVTTDDGVDTVKVAGFGANPLDVARDADDRYLSPEQSNAFPAADERSDVYSLGVLLHQMLTGQVPDIAKLKAGEPTPLLALRPELHPEVEPIVMTAIAADPEKRYQTVAAFAEDLDILAERVGGNKKARAAGAGTRNVWQTAFIVLAGICVLAVALIYATSNKKTDPTTQLQADAGSLPVQPIGPATGAQEESLAKLPIMTDAEIMATTAMEQPPGTLPGGDGFNAWANGGVPPAGAPPQSYVPPGGQIYTIDPNGGSQFMPTEGGVVLVPVPAANTAVDPKASASPRAPAANTAVQPGPATAVTPKPLATPPPKNSKPATTQPQKGKAAAEGKPSASGPSKDS